MIRIRGFAILALLTSCSGTNTPDAATTDPTASANPTEQAETGVDPSEHADVRGVAVSGDPGRYTFAVTVRSPDEGCERYANWWEVIDENGALVYRRILGHSHVDEQPFTRSGGPVEVAEDQRVFVRAHLHPTGYGGVVFAGTVGGGFAEVEVPREFGTELETASPQPTGCAF